MFTRIKILTAVSVWTGLAGSLASATTVRFRNGSQHPFLGWAYATVPFAPGQISSAQALEGYSLQGIPTELTPLKWHWQNGQRTSIALAKARALVYIPPQTTIEPALVTEAGWPHAYAFHPEIENWIATSALEDFKVVVRLASDGQYYTANLQGDLEVVESSKTQATFRIRSYFRSASGAPHPLSLTTYWSVPTFSNHGRVTVVIGNDTLELPLSGIGIAEAYVAGKVPLVLAPVDGAYSSLQGPYTAPDTFFWKVLDQKTLSDGQAFALDFAFAVTRSAEDPALQSIQAVAKFPILGISDADSWRASQAAGLSGHIGTPRFPTLEAGRAALESQCEVFTGDPSAGLGTNNVAPPSTGDQPDFGSGLPVFYTQTIQTGSVCALRKHLTGALRESWRPSYYWDFSRGKSDRVSALTYPNLFLWSGRPHYSPTWNPEYPLWTARAPLVADPANGWTGMDNQHAGHNGLRAVYELTASPYVADLLRANLSVLNFNFFTKWMASTEAERTGRIIKEAVALVALFPEAPEANLLKERIAQKNQVFLNAVNQYSNLYGVPAVFAIRDDARVDLTVQFPGQDVHMAWQAGFNLEGQVWAYRYFGDPASAQILDRYLSSAHLFFRPDGTPVTYFLMSNPSYQTLGGIGPEWWSGWMVANAARPNHPHYEFLRTTVRDLLKTRFVPTGGQYWMDSDRWNSFD